MTFPATRAGFADGFIRFRRTLDDHGLPPKARYRSELAFEEIVTNIIRHGYTDQRDHEIRVAVVSTVETVALIFEDDGVWFDPGSHHTDPRPSSIEETQIGGRGLLLVRAAARRLDYERTAEHRNRLTVTIEKT